MRTKAVFDNIAEHLEEQIDLAENKIVVAVAWFTNKRLFDAICIKAAEGVKVKLIISDNEINRSSNIDYDDIQIGESKLYLIDEEKMHNKFCIIDDYIVITGSYNWSYRAESNFENILICSGDSDLVKQYKKEVKKIIKDYLPEDDIKPKSRWEESVKSGKIKPYVPSVLKSVMSSTRYDFDSIKKGSQEWMIKNLDVDRFRNEDLIPHIKDKEEWVKAGWNKQPAWCYYDNNPENGKIYGKLYNWYAVNDKRGLAPRGWGLPGNGGWSSLKKVLGDDDWSWRNENEETWDENGDLYCFNNLSFGSRCESGFFERYTNTFWSTTENIGLTTYALRYWSDTNIELIRKNKKCGLSVRCVR